jgi:hypothetical protein
MTTDQKHTPEPWRVATPKAEQFPRYYIIGPDGGYVSAAVEAARIVACVNYCAGVATDDLIAGASSGGLRALVAADDALERQRDRLLAALHQVRPLIEQPGGRVMGDFAAVLVAIDSAISECQP